MLLSRANYGLYKQYPEKVLQFGSGNFLRGFADWIIDRMNKKADFNGSVVVVQSTSRNGKNLINDQDGLFTLYLKEEREGKEYIEHTIVNSISRSINTNNEYDKYISIAENPNMRFIISNTTEAGISFDETDRLDSNPQNSFPGKLTAFLYERYKIFQGEISKGLIIIPCELIDRNGDKLKEIVLRYAEVWKLEKEFVNWIHEANTFCCSLVDRVVSGFPKDKSGELFEELGYEDNLIVEGEFFHQWVIEGPEWIKEEFPTDIEGLNVLIVDNVDTYRTRKVRLLNGTHTALTPVSYLYGIDTVRESVENEVIGKYIRDIMFEEVIPTLNLPKDELEDFASSIIKRFKNPSIKHYLMSISLNSMSKFEARILPTILDYLNIYGKLPSKLLFSLAALIKFYSGIRDGEKIQLCDNEDILELYNKAWAEFDNTDEGLRKIAKCILSYKNVWKIDLDSIQGLTDMVSYYLIQIHEKGIREAMKEVL